jgi:hypothetical protein
MPLLLIPFFLSVAYRPELNLKTDPSKEAGYRIVTVNATEASRTAAKQVMK